MSEMCERVARAINAASESRHLPDELETMASAAIAAMREPTEGMLFKGYRAEPVPSMRAGVGHYRDAYRAMIDEALR